MCPLLSHGSQVQVSEAGKPARSILARIAGGAAIVLAAIVLFGGLAFGIFVLWFRAEHFSALKSIEQEVARIQGAGEPITVADMYAFHALPPGESNSTPLWLDVLSSIDEQRFDADTKSMPFVAKRISEETHFPSEITQWSDAAALLEKYQAPIQAAKSAAKSGGECRFPIKFEDGYAADLSHATRMNCLIRLLRLDVRAHFEHQDADSAIEAIEALLGAARAMEHQPTVVEQLTGTLAVNEAVGATTYLLNELQLDDEQLQRLHAALGGVEFDAGLTTGLLGERALMYQSFCSYSPPGVVSLTHGERVGLEPGRAMDCQKYLEVMASIIAATELPFPDARDLAREIELGFQDEVKEMNGLLKMKLANSIADLPGTYMFFDAIVRSHAYLNATIAAIASERCRIDSGSYPSQLSDLVPKYIREVPQDPLDGSPMKSQVSHKEIVVYSVGWNLRDDGGRDDTTRAPLDFAVRVTPVKRSR
jgi:hypothetical protein